MNPDDLVSKYFAAYIRKGFRKILAEQRIIAANKIYGKKAYYNNGSPRSRSGRLMKALQNPEMAIDTATAGITARINYPTYIRFLDMKRLGNYRIYNRPIWGILYKETFRDIRFEFRKWLDENFKIDIEEIYKPQ